MRTYDAYISYLLVVFFLCACLQSFCDSSSMSAPPRYYMYIVAVPICIRFCCSSFLHCYLHVGICYLILSFLQQSCIYLSKFTGFTLQILCLVEIPHASSIVREVAKSWHTPLIYFKATGFCCSLCRVRWSQQQSPHEGIMSLLHSVRFRRRS